MSWSPRRISCLRLVVSEVAGSVGGSVGGSSTCGRVLDAKGRIFKDLFAVSDICSGMHLREECSMIDVLLRAV